MHLILWERAFFPPLLSDYQFCLYSIADSCHLNNKLDCAEAPICTCVHPVHHLYAHHHVVPISQSMLLYTLQLYRCLCARSCEKASSRKETVFEAILICNGLIPKSQVIFLEGSPRCTRQVLQMHVQAVIKPFTYYKITKIGSISLLAEFKSMLSKKFPSCNRQTRETVAYHLSLPEKYLFKQLLTQREIIQIRRHGKEIKTNIHK